MTTGFDELQRLLHRWDARRRRAELLRRLPQGLLLGLALGLAAALISRARPWLTRGELAQIAAVLAAIATVLATLLILAWRRSTADQARFADRQFGLRERMITAVEIAQGDLAADGAVAARQLRDALEAAAGVDVVRRLPLALHPADWFAPLVAAALLLFVLWRPNPMEAVLLEQRAVAALVEEQAAILTHLAEAVATNEELTPRQREALLRPLDEARARLAEPNVGREEAVAALSEAEAELRELSRDFDAAALGAAAEVAAALGSQGPAAEPAQALEAGDATRAAAAASALADAVSAFDAETRAELSEQLAAAADSPATDEALAGSLARAAEALETGDMEAAREALSEIAATLAESATAASAAEQASLAADRLGEARQEVAQGGIEPGDAGGENAAQGADGSGADGEGGAAANSGAQPGAGGPTQGGGHVENVFVPDSVPLDGEGEAVELETQCLTDSEACGPTAAGPLPLPPEASGGQLVPYDRVFGDYRNAAFEALGQGSIPIRLEGLIRDYFTALEP